jgi:TolA-binding protein
MNRVLLDSNVRELESFFAVERVIVPEPEEVRERVIERARAALSPKVLTLSANSPRPSGVSVGVATAFGVTLTALCAAAFLAGYRVRNRNVEPTGIVTATAPSVVIQQVPSHSVVVALIPVAPPASQLAWDYEAVRPAKPNKNGNVKSPIDVETYAKELRVLQPARQAVAQQDFGAALSAIAEHQQLFPSGRLTEEREALRVKALLGLGRTAEAQRAGAAFHTNFPRSALLGRIDEMLGKKK